MQQLSGKTPFLLLCRAVILIGSHNWNPLSVSYMPKGRFFFSKFEGKGIYEAEYNCLVSDIRAFKVIIKMFLLFNFVLFDLTKGSVPYK